MSLLGLGGLVIGEGAPGDVEFARVLFAQGCQIRCFQHYASRGGHDLWYVSLIEKYGGPDKVMCTTPLPLDGYYVECVMPVSRALACGAVYKNIALVKFVPYPENPEELEVMPLCDFELNGQAAAEHVSRIKLMPQSVLDHAHALFGGHVSAKCRELEISMGK